MNKKLFLLIFFIIMILQIGCSKNIEQKQQPFSVSVLYNNVEDANYQEDWLIFEQYKNKFDIDFNVILGDDTNFEKEIDLHIQSDNAPDIILKCYPDFIKQYANEGLLLAISDYTSMMPHFLDYIEKNGLEDEIEKLKLANGKFYIMPGYQRRLVYIQWIGNSKNL
jgi:putative aldouronate transport system substrate-binding protein